MKLKYTFILLFLIAPWTLGKTVAQSNGSNSSYSRFGLGLLSDQANSYNRSMGGVGQALRSNSRINFLNPASYSAVDSLTFLFDVGMSLQRSRMVQDNAHVGVSNTSFDFVTAAFRMRRHLGMTLGFKPYTRIGYSFSHEENVGLDYSTGEQITSPSEYDGEGGLHEAFIGVGWEPFKGFSFGANVGVLWGNIKHSILTAYSQNSVLSTTDGNITTLYDASIVTWRGDVGVQYQTVLNSMNRLTFGATVGIGHKINNDASYISSTNASTADTLVAAKGFQLPMTYSFGLAWEHAERLLVAADVHYEQWGKCTTPEFDKYAKTYAATTGTYKDRLRVNLGAEYVPGRYERPFRQRLNYRIGAFFSTPYLRINGQNGPTEFGLSAGVGFPITNGWANMNYLNHYFPTYVNVGFQWTNRSAGAAGFVRENIVQLNIGLTFNERWFMKWKFK